VTFLKYAGCDQQRNSCERVMIAWGIVVNANKNCSCLDHVMIRVLVRYRDSQVLVPL